VNINGIRAFTLFDSGSTFDSVLPALAKAAGLELEDPIVLQMAVKGSTSKVNRGTYASCRVGPIDTKHYFDISNIDHYQCIIGMPFMHTHDVKLALGSRQIQI
ncbi:hypothetical protein K474DRAFT_1574695, partial [Panus rudis PR-1116 ss-1]